jgi:hypothetical protein
MPRARLQVVYAATGRNAGDMSRPAGQPMMGKQLDIGMDDELFVDCTRVGRFRYCLSFLCVMLVMLVSEERGIVHWVYKEEHYTARSRISTSTSTLELTTWGRRGVRGRGGELRRVPGTGTMETDKMWRIFDFLSVNFEQTHRERGPLSCFHDFNRPLVRRHEGHAIPRLLDVTT